MALLDKANGADSRSEKAKILQESFDKFNAILTDLRDTSQLSRHINLKEVVNAYKKHSYWIGIVDLCLRYAQAIDPQGRAVAYAADQFDDGLSKIMFDARTEAYNYVTGILEHISSMRVTTPEEEEERRRQKEQATLRALRSNDELFHTHLYEWHLKQKLGGDLAKLDTPYLERFLKGLGENCGDLLWHFYYNTRQHGKAIKELQQLAEKGPGLSLEQRLEKLNSANLIMNEGFNVGRESVQLLREKIDVAEIQLYILNALEKRAVSAYF